MATGCQREFFYPHINISTSFQPDLFNIHGSSIHIFKSLSNLISNAVEAMPKGGRIEIATSILDRLGYRSHAVASGKKEKSVNSGS